MADAKITELVAGTLSSDDLLTFVDDPSGTPVNKKIAYSSFLAGLSITESQISDLGTYLSTADIDTLAELNAIVADDTIIGAAATDASSFGFVVDEDNLASNLDTKVPTQQSVKAYVDSVVAGLTALEAEDIDTLAEINAIIGDATLVTVEATDASGYGFVIDEDDMVSDSATKVPTQQSVKAYVDAEIAGVGGGSGGLTVTAKTAGYTAANGDLVVCDSSGGAFNVTMPASPTTDDRIGIYLEDGSAAAAVTVQGNGKVLAEFGTAVTLQTPGDVIVFQYDGAKWAIAANGIQTYSLSLLAADSIDEDADYIRIADGDATEDYEKRATVKTMLAPYIEDSTLGTAAGDIVYRPTANDHWTNLPAGEDAGLGGVPNFPIASQAEAEAGTATNRLMNPLRTAQAIAALESGGSPAWGDITGTLADQTDLQAELDAKADASHAHAASDITSGTLAHERGGLEADISSIAIGDIVAGTGTGTVGIITATGHSEGDVLAIQEDGSVDFETPAVGCGGLMSMLGLPDVSKGVYSGNSYAGSSNLNGARLSNDGAKLFLCNGATVAINALNLTTAFDISAVSSTNTFSVSGQVSGFNGIEWSANGMKFYALSTNDKTIYQYTVSSAFDITGASYASKSYLHNHTNANGFAISSDGKKLFVAAGGVIHSHTMSTAEDISTASSDSVTFNDTRYTYDLYLSDDDRFLFKVNEGIIYQYGFAVPGDLSTLVDMGVTLDVSNRSTDMYGLCFSSDMTFMAVCDITEDDVWQYDLPAANGGYVQKEGIHTLIDGATVTIDARHSKNQRVVLGGNRTLAFSNFKAGQTVCVRLTQDGTGSRTVTWPSSGVTINWHDGTEPTLTTTANKADWIVIICTDDTSGAEVYDAARAMENV